MAGHESQVGPDDAANAWWKPRLLPHLREEIAQRLGGSVRWPNPIVAYRGIALGLAFAVVASRLHAHSDLRDDGWILLLALAHVIVTHLAVDSLTQQTDIVNAVAIVIDIGMCVLLLTLTYGWQGPFWMYAISAVFWPSVRFLLRGAVASVAVFWLFILVANGDLVREAVDDGFVGDLVARGLMVLVVAGAIALTAQAMAKVRVMAAEAERNRIARDLHDGIGKTMGGISLEARSLAQWVARDPVEASRRARYVARVSERAANEVRDVIRGLRQSEATALLLPAVEDVISEWRAALDIPIHLRVNGQDHEIPVLIQGEIVRMLGELLRNVGQHAAATDVRVRLTLSSSGITLAVRDDGRGFDPDALDPWSGDGHFGLLGTRERASMLGGYCRIRSAPGEGTDVTVDIPLSTRPERAFWTPSVLRMSERL